MGIMAEAFLKADLKPTDFENRQVNEKTIELDMEIEFMEKWLKLCERKASEKEKYRFVREHGFVSVKQFNLYMACNDDVSTLREELDEIRDCISSTEIKKREKKIAEKETMTRNIKDEIYYRMVMRSLGQKDYSPYGENLLRTRRA